MGSRGSFDHMLQVAKKKPKLQAVVDNIDDYTEEQIDELKEYQTWIRKHLKGILRHKEAIKAKNVKLAEDDLIVDQLTIPGTANNIELMYDVYEYIGTGEWIGDSNESFNYEIDEGDIFFFVNERYVKINSTGVKYGAGDHRYLMAVSKYIDKMSISQYNKYLQTVIEKKYGDNLEDERNSEYGYWSAVRIER